MATANGIIKKTALRNFSRPRPSGIIEVKLADGDRLIGAILTDGSNDLMLVSSNGKAIRFSEERVREMGRAARGVRGIAMDNDAEAIALISLAGEETILTVTENGYGKRTKYDEFPVRGRGGKGVIAIQTNKRNGKVIGAVSVKEQHEIMLITDRGTLVRQAVSGISIIGRNTQGIRLQKFKNDSEQVVGLQPIVDDLVDQK